MAEQRSTRRCLPAVSKHPTKFSRGSDAMQVFANHTEVFGGSPVTLVLDLSMPTYLCALHENDSLRNVNREFRGMMALPAEGIYYRGHHSMIGRLQAERARVKTLVVVLPDDKDHESYYSEAYPGHDSEEALRKIVGILQDVMRFAAPTAERVAFFNAGARLDMLMMPRTTYPPPLRWEKPLALALPGTRFAVCRELVVSRNYYIYSRFHELDYIDDMNDDLYPHKSPWWRISSETFPELQEMHTVADRIKLRGKHRIGFTSDIFCDEITQADADNRPRPNIGVGQRGPVETLNHQIISEPYFGLGCTVQERFPSCEGFSNSRFSRIPVIPIPPSPYLPAMYIDVHQLIERVQARIPR